MKNRYLTYHYTRDHLDGVRALALPELDVILDVFNGDIESVTVEIDVSVLPKSAGQYALDV